MKGKEAFDNSLKMTIITLWISGISVYNNNREFLKKIFSTLFYFNLLWLYTDVFGEFFWLIEGIQSGKSFGELSMIAPCTTICLLATAKSAPLHFNRDLLMKVFNKLKELHPVHDNEDPIPLNNEIYEDETKDMDETKLKEIEKKMVNDALKFINIVSTFLSICFSMVVIVFSLSPLMSMAYDYHTEGKTDLKLPFLVKYFFDPFTKSRWPLFYFHQVWSSKYHTMFEIDFFLYF